MAKKFVRLSGADIDHINQLRGCYADVYEVVNGKPMYRLLLKDEEIRSLERDRKKRMQKVANILLKSEDLDTSKYSVEIVVKHKKKQYKHSFSSK